MKQKILSFAKIIMVVAAFAIAATVAYAWTPPTAAPTGGNVPAPVNTGTVDQTKNANLGVTKSFFAGIDVAANNMVMGLKGVFGCNGWSCYLANTSSGANPNAFSAGLFSSGGLFTKGLQVSPAGVSVISGPLAIISGGPGSGKVLTSDATGNATWENATAQQTITPTTTTTNGLITYVRQTGTGSARADCPTESIVIGGGGNCRYGVAWSKPLISGVAFDTDYSGPGPATGWQVACLQNLAAGGGGRVVGTDAPAGNTPGYAIADAICMKKTDVVTDVAIASGGGNGGGGSSSGGTWHYAGNPTNPTASTCGAAYGVSNQNVGYIAAGAVSPYNFNAPADVSDPYNLPPNAFGPIHFTPGSCAVSPNGGFASTLPNGTTWVSQFTTLPSHFQGGQDFEYRYYTLIKS